MIEVCKLPDTTISNCIERHGHRTLFTGQNRLCRRRPKLLV